MHRTDFLLRTVLVAILLVAGYLAVRQYLPFLSNPSELKEGITGFGLFAPLAFIALQVIQVVVSPIPGHAMGVVSGYLFGSIYGTIYSVVGAAIGSGIAFGLSRRYESPLRGENR